VCVWGVIWVSTGVHGCQVHLFVQSPVQNPTHNHLQPTATYPPTQPPPTNRPRPTAPNQPPQPPPLPKVFRPPFDEFEIQLVEVPPGESVAVPTNPGPLLLLVQKGAAEAGGG
jgi:hypothetical protein